MGSPNYIKDLLALSPPEVVIRLTSQRKELQAAITKSAESWSACEQLVRHHLFIDSIAGFTCDIT